MKRTFLLTVILIIGLFASQALPTMLGELPDWLSHSRQLFTMWLLAFIMFEVGREFRIDFKAKRQYAIDYGVAATAAAFPWIFVTIYFLAFLMPETTATGRAPWVEALLAGRFAAPTSAGVLFSMLASAGLAETWVYRKARILAIFDDLDTVLLMIPLKIFVVGLVWQLGGVVVALAVMIGLSLRYYRRLSWPTNWPWALCYAFAIAAVSEVVYGFTKDPASNVGLHIEVLLPAFLLGCALKAHDPEPVVPGEDAPGETSEERAGFVVSCAFLFLVGFSMPAAFGPQAQISNTLGPWELAWHVFVVTVLSNVGKMFAVFCYRKEASFKERLAVSVAMFPRGEVGAGVLAVALSYGVTGPFVTVAFLSLVLNLVLTGAFIFVVKLLLASDARATAEINGRESAYGV